MTSVTASEFNQRPSQVKRAAEHEPVLITERGRPSFVLMTHAEYQRLQGAPGDLVEWLRMDEDIDFEIEPVGFSIGAADL
ncbi:MAG: type II toxin-antitoxin system Phd/YefM family antitoxin [Nocardioides sp.]